MKRRAQFLLACVIVELSWFMPRRVYRWALRNPDVGQRIVRDFTGLLRDFVEKNKQGES